MLLPPDKMLFHLFHLPFSPLLRKRAQKFYSLVTHLKNLRSMKFSIDLVEAKGLEMSGRVEEKEANVYAREFLKVRPS